MLRKIFPKLIGLGEAVGNFLLPKRRSGIEWPQRCPSTPEWCRRPGPMMSCSCWGNPNCFKRVVWLVKVDEQLQNKGKEWHYLFSMKMNMEMKNNKEEMIMAIGVMMMIMMRMTMLSKRLYVINFIYCLTFPKNGQTPQENTWSLANFHLVQLFFDFPQCLSKFRTDVLHDLDGCQEGSQRNGIAKDAGCINCHIDSHKEWTKPFGEVPARWSDSWELLVQFISGNHHLEVPSSFSWGVK